MAKLISKVSPPPPSAFYIFEFNEEEVAHLFMLLRDDKAYGVNWDLYQKLKAAIDA